MTPCRDHGDACPNIRTLDQWRKSSALVRSGRFAALTDDALCLNRECGRPLREHRPDHYGPPQARVGVPLSCPID